MTVRFFCSSIQLYVLFSLYLLSPFISGFVCTSESNIFVSWSTSEWSGWYRLTSDFLLTVPRLCFFCGSFLLFSFHFWLHYTVFFFLTALWSPAGKADLLTLLCMMFLCVLSLTQVVSWVRCGTWLYWLLIFAFLTFIFKEFTVWFRQNHVWLFSIFTNGKSCQRDTNIPI